MSRQEFSINVSTPSGARPVVLQLDPAQMSQKGMLDSLRSGQMYEPETSNVFASVLRPGDTFIDIGAHVGFFSMLASALVGPTGAVYSFEPEPRNFAHLLDHIAANAATNVRPMHMAVGAAPGVAEFYVNTDNDGGHALWEVGKHPFNEQTRATPQHRKVFVTTLDQVFEGRDVSTLRAMKIDSEGAEFSIITGARQTLTRYPIPFIVAEINRFGLQAMGTSEAELRALFTELGYETYAFPPGQTNLARLNADQFLATDYVFNLLFRHPVTAT
jgi:FkbM family methyltransferase